MDILKELWAREKNVLLYTNRFAVLEMAENIDFLTNIVYNINIVI